MTDGFFYLASPYSNYALGKDAAFNHVCEDAALLFAHGISVFCPIAHTHPIAEIGHLAGGYETWQHFDEAMMDASRGCIVCMLPGWDTSVGVTAEIAFFDKLHKPVIYMTPGVVPPTLIKDSMSHVPKNHDVGFTPPLTDADYRQLASVPAVGYEGLTTTEIVKVELAIKPRLLGASFGNHHREPECPINAAVPAGELLKQATEKKKPSPLEEFDKAIKGITDQRGKVYGHPSDNFDRAQRLKDVVSECRDPQLREAMEMICVKLARLIETPDHVDSWVDVAGFSRTGVMVLDKRVKDKESGAGSCR